MSVRIKFIIGGKAVTGNMMWVMVGFALVILGAVLFTMIAYYGGARLDIWEWLDYYLCKLSNGSWCSDDTRVKLSVNSLVEGINYVCANGGVTEKPNSNFVTCDGSDENAACSVYFFMPQATAGAEDWIPGAGDPKYLVYHEAFPPGEDAAWSGWQTISMAFMAMPFIKSAGSAFKQGIKEGIFVVGKEKSIETVAEAVKTFDPAQTTLDQWLGTKAPDVVTVGLKEKLSSVTLNDKMLEGMKNGYIGVSAGITTAEAAKYAASLIKKFIPCESNSLCVKSAITVNSNFIEPKTFKLSEMCKDTYIELSKRWDMGTKFYLGSPCNARLDIKRGKCGCVVGKAELGGKDMTICSEYSNFPEYQSDCIKIEPHAIDTGKQNFCYTPPKVFGYIATGLSLASDFGLNKCIVAAPTGVGALVCYGASAAGKGIALYLEALTAWPHGFLEAE